MPLQYDPEFAQLAAPVLQLIAQAKRPALHDINTRRSSMDAFAAGARGKQLPNDVERLVHYAQATDGYEIPIVHLRKKEACQRGAAAVIHMHGGGLFALSADVSVPTLAGFVSQTGVQILSVDYRLAPEHVFPVPLEDCWAGLNWVHAHAQELAIDKARIAVMGESAGGGLAACLAVLARDRKLAPPLAKQILSCPMLDDRTVTNHVGELAFWTEEDNITGWSAYLGKEVYGTDSVSPYAAAARVESVEGLPPLFLECPELDIFVHEDLKYATRFIAAGITTELYIYDGLPHGFEGFAPTSGAVKRATANRARALSTI